MFWAVGLIPVSQLKYSPSAVAELEYELNPVGSLLVNGSVGWSRF
jgi:hypothetical protein